MPKAQQVQDAELPDDGAERRYQGEDGEDQRLREIEQQHGGDDARDTEENQHALGAIGDVADHLGKADNVDADVGILVFVADVLLQGGGDLGVIQPLAGLGIHFKERGDDGGPGEIVGHQHADSA